MRGPWELGHSSGEEPRPHGPGHRTVRAGPARGGHHPAVRVIPAAGRQGGGPSASLDGGASGGLAQWGAPRGRGAHVGALRGLASTPEDEGA